MIRVLVSACLLGEKVRYNGADARAESAVLGRWLAEGRLVPFCPEVAGGLGVPRPAAEIVQGEGRHVLDRTRSIVTAAGADVTQAFLEGARQALREARANDVGIAVLKDGSPSCGSAYIYDGSFSGTRRAGKGVTATLLEANGIRVFSERQLDEAAACLDDLEKTMATGAPESSEVGVPNPVGAAYDAFMGRWSRMVAREFIPWLSVPSGRKWLDVGCGTGALTSAILETMAPEAVASVDPCEDYIRYLRTITADLRGRACVGRGQDLPFRREVFDAAVSGLALNLVSDPGSAVAEMIAVVVSGGVVAAYVWDFAAGMELLRIFWDTATRLDRAAAELDQANAFPICEPNNFADLFFTDYLTPPDLRSFTIPTVFRDFDDYWSAFEIGQGRAPGYVQSLDQQRRGILRENLRAALPARADGSIHLAARAWAIKARRKR